MNLRAVYVVDGCRTPFLKAGGAPGPFTASDLAVAAGRVLFLRLGLPAPTLDEVILGCVSPRADEANIARIVALRLGCGKRVPAWTVQRNCASGLQALDSARLDIATGRAELVLAGGTEAMSHAPVLWSERFLHVLAAWRQARGMLAKSRALARLRPADLLPVPGLLLGLKDPIAGLSMGQTAEILAQRFDITRAEMDAYALASHQRLAAAVDAGALDDEVVALAGSDGQGYRQDAGLRRDTTLEKLSNLKPVFDKNYGNLTAGNSAQISDGACVLLLASGEAISRYRLPVLGRLVDCAWAGVEPEQMGLGPVHAIAALLRAQQLAAARVDYWEINEAFAAQVLACLRACASEAYGREELGLDGALGLIPGDRLNLDGGAISLGHPVGASGARIVLHALRVLRQSGGQRAIASLCIGGGQGGAALLTGERP